MTEAVWIAVIAAVGAFIGTIVNSVTSLKAKKFDYSLADIKRMIADNTKQTEDAQKKIAIVSQTLADHIENRKEVDSTYKEALKILLRENIDEMYRIYYKRDKCMSTAAKEELEETFAIYKALGGNHIGEKRYLKMLELPEPDEAEHI